MKTLLLVLTLFLSSIVQAQFRDRLSIAHSEKNSENVLKLGLPPFFHEKLTVFNSFEYKSFNLATQNLDLRSLNYNITAKLKTADDDREFISGISTSFRQNSEFHNLNSESKFYTGYFLYNIKTVALKSSYQIGFVFLDKSSRYSIMPALTYNHESSDSKHQFKISYPSSHYIYNYNEGLKLGLIAAQERSTYRVFDADYDYFSIERTLIAGLVRKKLGGSSFFATLKMTRAFKEKYFQSTTQTLKSDKTVVKDGSENFLEIGISYGSD